MINDGTCYNEKKRVKLYQGIFKLYRNGEKRQKGEYKCLYKYNIG